MLTVLIIASALCFVACFGLLDEVLEPWLDRQLAARRARARRHITDPHLAAHHHATTRLTRQEPRP